MNTGEKHHELQNLTIPRLAPVTLSKSSLLQPLDAQSKHNANSTMGFKKLSKIQAITLPKLLTPPHKDLVAQAHNGSGKTTCFVLGMLSRVDPDVKAPQALCICPTRVGYSEYGGFSEDGEIHWDYFGVCRPFR